MNGTIVAAIAAKRRLTFLYNGKTRIVEPQCYGVGTKGTELLRAYQLSDGAHSEPLFDVSKMSGLVALEERFTHPAPNYKQNDSAMKVIYAQL